MGMGEMNLLNDPESELLQQQGSRLSILWLPTRLSLTWVFEFLQRLFKQESGGMGVKVTLRSQTVRADDQQGNKCRNGHSGHGSTNGARGR